MLLQHFGFYDETNPRPRLSQLFETDAEFVSKIRATFGCASLFVIGCGRGSAAHQLTADMPTHSCTRQRIDNFTHAGSKVNESFRQLIRCYLVLS